jgi:hypothetical protein
MYIPLVFFAAKEPSSNYPIETKKARTFNELTKAIQLEFV